MVNQTAAAAATRFRRGSFDFTLFVLYKFRGGELVAAAAAGPRMHGQPSVASARRRLARRSFNHLSLRRWRRRSFAAPKFNLAASRGPLAAARQPPPPRRSPTCAQSFRRSCRQDAAAAAAAAADVAQFARQI